MLLFNVLKCGNENKMKILLFLWQLGLIAGTTAVVGGIGAYIAVKGAVNASTELMLHPPKYPWWHRGWFTEIDKKR